MRDVQDAPFVPTMYSHLLSVFKSILKPDPKFCSPSAIYYDVNGDIARVQAVLDCRRNPSWTRTRLEEKR